MSINFNSDTWQEFDYESLNNVEDCAIVMKELDVILDDISNQIRVAEIKINKGEGSDVDSEWYRLASNALSHAKRKKKWVSDLRLKYQKENNFQIKIEEKNRTEQIIELLQSISHSLLTIAEKATQREAV